MVRPLVAVAIALTLMAISFLAGYGLGRTAGLIIGRQRERRARWDIENARGTKIKPD